MTARPLHQQYIIYKGSGGGSDPDPAVFCPAEGYILPEDCPVPDPAVFCPANGYTPDPVFEPDEPWPELETPSENEIIFLCTDENQLSFTMAISNSGTYSVLIYGNDNVIISQTDGLSGNHTFVLPEGQGYPEFSYTIYKVHVFASEGSVIGGFSFASTNPDKVVLSMIINCPSIVNLQNLCRYVNASRLKSVVFVGDTYSSLSRLEYAFYGKNSLQEARLPKYCDSLNQFNHAFFGCSSLLFLSLPLSMISVTTIQSCFEGAKTSVINFPNLPALLTANRAFYAATIDEMHFTGASDNCIDFSLTFQNAVGFYKLTLPSSLLALQTIGSMFHSASLNCDKIIFPQDTPYLNNINSCFYNTTGVLYVKLPAYMPSLINTYIGSLFFGCANLIKIDAFYADHNDGVYGSVYRGVNLREFNCPNLRARSLGVVGTGTGAGISKVTYINIDYANSQWVAAVTVINFRYNSLPATELNRIFTALPTVSGGTFGIDARNNPGSAACDITIATAKGWTVTR